MRRGRLVGRRWRFQCLRVRSCFCQDSQSMMTEKEKTSSRIRRWLSIDDYLSKPEKRTSGNRVKTPSTPRIDNAPNGVVLNRRPQQAVPLQSFVGIGGTTRIKTAVRPEQGTNKIAIKTGY